MKKTCLILGAGSDMARATARLLASEGWDLQLAARSPEKLAEDMADLQTRAKPDRSITSHAFDATNLASHQGFWDGLPTRPDLVICFVGVMGDHVEACRNEKLREEIMMANYVGPANLFSIIANDFEAAGEGTLIGVSSVAGLRGRQANYIYGSAKAGFSTFLSGLRNRLHVTGAHCITILPGFVRTSMTEGMDLPAKLTAEPDEVASAILSAYQKGRNIVYVRPIWYLIMTIITNIPEFVFKRLNI